MDKPFAFYIKSIAGWDSFLLNTAENKKIVDGYAEVAKEHHCFKIVYLYEKPLKKKLKI